MVIWRMATSEWLQANGYKQMATIDWLQASGCKRMVTTEWLQASGSNRLVTNAWLQDDGYRKVNIGPRAPGIPRASRALRERGRERKFDYNFRLQTNEVPNLRDDHQSSLEERATSTASSTCRLLFVLRSSLPSAATWQARHKTSKVPQNCGRSAFFLRSGHGFCFRSSR